MTRNNTPWEEDSIKVNDADGNLAFEVIEGRVSPSTLLPVSGDIAEGEVTPIADFAIEDVNESSATFGTQVSPRDYLNSVSAWYFGHST